MPKRTIDFNQLPQATRERFIRCVANQQLPQPLLSHRLTTAMAAVGWGFMLLCAAGGIVAIALAGFGTARDLGLQGPGFVILYALLAFVAIYSVLAIIKRGALVKSLPFQPGRYLFPMDFVDARSNVLTIIPMATMVDFRGVHHHTNGVYTNTVFTFRFEGGITQTLTINGKQAAENALASLRSIQREIAAAVEAKDVDKLYQLDVFFEARMKDWQPDPFSAPVPPLAQPLPPLLQNAALVALGAGLVVGPPTWFVRELASDAAAYARIANSDDVYEIERYAREGGRRAKEARNELIPRCKLRIAEREGSVTAFRGVEREFPDHEVAKEARAKIAALYAKNLRDFDARAADDPNMRSFMERLFQYLQQHDTSSMVVRFDKPDAKELAQADRDASKNVPGGVVPIDNNFDDASSAPREKAIVEELQGAFKQVFPADIFALEQGQRYDGAIGAVTQPTIAIHYAVRGSGDYYTSDKTHKNFVGIVVDFDVAMKIPGDDRELAFKLKVLPPDHFTVSYDTRYGVYAGSDDTGLVYHTMATKAFEQLSHKLRGVFFRGEGGGIAEASAPPARPAAVPGSVPGAGLIPAPKIGEAP